jgi:hypothetical protein
MATSLWTASRPPTSPTLPTSDQNSKNTTGLPFQTIHLRYGNLISRCVALASAKQLPVPPAFDARDSKLLDDYAAAVLAISARFRLIQTLNPH